MMDEACPMYLGPSPQKRPKLESDKHTINYYKNRCVICLKKARKNEKLVTPQNEGKTTLHNKMREQNDETYQQLEQDEILNDTGFMKPVKYHRVCYQKYTRSKTESCDENVPSTSGESHRKTRSGSVTFDTTKCLFCNCRKRHGDKVLVRISSPEVQTSIRDAVNAVKDTEMKDKIQDYDLIAMEARYHKNCLGTYLMNANRFTNRDDVIDTDAQDCFAEAFEKLVGEITQPLLMGASFDMNDLLDKYRLLLAETGYTNSERYRATRLKIRLKDHFQAQIVFHKMTNVSQPELVYSSSVDIKKVINKLADLKRRVKEEAIEADLTIPDDDSENIMDFREAMKLRSSIRQLKEIPIKDCIDSEDISTERIEQLVPEDLFTFLSFLTTGKMPSDVRNDLTLNRRVLSIAQDIIYATTSARCRTPKHVGLAISVKHLTGSKQIIEMLHSQGHSISYTDVCKYESEVATQVMSKATDEGGHFLPSNIYPGTFSHAAMDNIDINEETRSGKGTTHVLGSLIYQDQNTKLPTNVHSVPAVRVGEPNRKLASDLLECPNRYKRTANMSHLKGKIDAKSWMVEERPILSLNKSIMFARLCPVKILEVDIVPSAPEEQCIPGWKGCQAILRHKFENGPSKTTIGYNPVVQGIPTDWNTIYTGLKLIEKQMRTIGQETPVVTLDLQLYIIAQEIRLRNWDELGHHVLRLGGFHIMELFWKILGKRYASSGFEDILVEANVFGPNAASHIMAGGNYKRCTLAHKLMYEVMCRLLFVGFLSWLVAGNRLSDAEIEYLESSCAEVQSSVKEYLSSSEDNQIRDHTRVRACFEQLKSTLDSHSELYDEYLENGRNTSNTFAFWEQYISGVEIALDYIAAEKIPSWEQHLKCFADICCYAFAYDRQNYARWGPVYIAEMLRLPETDPDISETFESGKHVVNRSESGSFNSVWSDLGLEQTVVKDTKSKTGGVIGFSRQHNAMLKWYMTVHERSAVLRNFKAMCGLNSGAEVTNHECKASVILKDEKDIAQITRVVMDRFGNPFVLDMNADTEEPSPLINIATGTVSPDDVTTDLLNAVQIGQKSFLKFVEERLNTESTPIHAPIKRLKLKTFASIARKKNSKDKGKTQSVQCDRDLFGRLVVISKERNVDLENLFEYELSSIPLAIADEDGSLAKTNKAQTLRDLETEISSTLFHEEFMSTCGTNKTENGVFIDHMACVQKVSSRTGVNTFGDIVVDLEKFVNTAFTEGNTVHVISDRYDSDQSVKAGERKRRGFKRDSPEVIIHSEQQSLPRNMRNYLSNPKNKDNLNDYVFTEWVNTMPAKLQEGQCLVLSGGFRNHDRAVSIVRGEVNEIEPVYSSQEEADTRLLLHVNDSKTRFNIKTAIIWSPDTDVLVLATHFQDSIGIPIWFKTGTRKNIRYIPVHKISEKLVEERTSHLLLPFHALTGSDSTSCFKGKGKKKGLKILRKHREEYKELSHLGESLQLQDSVIQVCENFVCRLYSPSNVRTDINELRYKQFCKKPVQNQSLPPCKDSLVQHIKRANYQTAIWKRSLQPKPEIDSPEGHGWIATDDGLRPQLMTQASAPQEIVELTTCHCKESRCAAMSCKCLKARLRCTAACSCEGSSDHCENSNDQSDKDTSDGEFSDSESDEN